MNQLHRYSTPNGLRQFNVLGVDGRVPGQAARSAHFEEGQTIQLFGESLASYSVASMASVISKGEFKPLHISKMELIETVNAYGDTSIIYMLNIMKTSGTVEDERRGMYSAENIQIGYSQAVLYEQISSGKSQRTAIGHAVLDSLDRMASYASKT